MIAWNDSYLNRTPNKTARQTMAFTPEFVVMHETAGYGSLEWNLKPSVRSSYNYLISRAGVVYHYVDERRYIAWHAGVNSAARGYTGGQLNIYAIGVELEGPNDGTPITTAQTQAMIALLRYFNQTYGIPLTRDYILGHKEVAPGYKSDPKGYSVESTLRLIADQAPVAAADRVVLGVAPAITQVQFVASLQRHDVAMSTIEMGRIFELLRWMEIAPHFFIALWKAEDATFGRSPLQLQTRMPINIKAASDEWRPTVAANGARWLAAESLQLGALMSAMHLKNVHGWLGRHTVRSIVAAHAPASDGNDVERICASILEDMAYIEAH